MNSFRCVVRSPFFRCQLFRITDSLRDDGKRNNGKLTTQRKTQAGLLTATMVTLFSAAAFAQQPSPIGPPPPNTIVVDAFDSVSHWTPAVADGIARQRQPIRRDAGRSARRQWRRK